MAESDGPKAWYFGLMREAGGYRIVAAGPSVARIDRELAHYQVATMIGSSR